MLLFSTVLTVFSYKMEKKSSAAHSHLVFCINDEKDIHKEVPAYACTEKFFKKKKFKTWKKFSVWFCFIWIWVSCFLFLFTYVVSPDLWQE